jgi:hypothetical protein
MIISTGHDQQFAHSKGFGGRELFGAFIPLISGFPALSV